MAVSIEKKIVGFEVVSKDAEAAADIPTETTMAEVVRMQPALKRPAALHGSTYKITTPMSEHALYITINDMVINEGTELEYRRPFEIFINSKNMENFAWIVALTRVVSAVFRHGGDVSFLVEELRSVFDPRGGYFKPGGKYMPSLVAEIGECIENHLREIGMIRAPEVSPELEEKRRMAEDQGLAGSQCPKCGQLSVVRLDGCETCLECGHSKCG
ncbi:TSCPD domain-containing protein [Magnetofaba australis]|uniref:ribonucleoside-diphosphate reductase n=1 Tax=Magnetofaba australis IT-1 TaxID=1434232 RepID=A0A1Y2K381_9PROT|nr:TSCPD domain-containing protein [Magnetofaba australis]OSM01495.1 putative NrdJb [Magnetofaba australis IT-1]